MKTTVDFDFEWSLNACLRYSRRQVALMNFMVENDFSMTDAVEVMKDAKSEKDAVNRFGEKFGMNKMVAKELLEMSMSRMSNLNPKGDRNYFSRVIEALTPLSKEAAGK